MLSNIHMFYSLLKRKGIKHRCHKLMCCPHDNNAIANLTWHCQEKHILWRQESCGQKWSIAQHLHCYRCRKEQVISKLVAILTLTDKLCFISQHRETEMSPQYPVVLWPLALVTAEQTSANISIPPFSRCLLAANQTLSFVQEQHKMCAQPCILFCHLSHREENRWQINR